ncbi:hypothetical protein [Candidatus Magnetaquiglobus chichijimensis]|uniref:hypothetical protein n=1 Tax=Candidatus Magnetaquiglobus chichijimensis TaxID=3141448 RepID=UPI003B9788BF
MQDCKPDFQDPPLMEVLVDGKPKMRRYSIQCGPIFNGPLDRKDFSEKMVPETFEGEEVVYPLNGGAPMIFKVR